jgi:hypothetical protein
MQDHVGMVSNLKELAGHVTLRAVTVHAAHSSNSKGSLPLPPMVLPQVSAVVSCMRDPHINGGVVKSSCHRRPTAWTAA